MNGDNPFAPKTRILLSSVFALCPMTNITPGHQSHGTLSESGHQGAGRFSRACFITPLFDMIQANIDALHAAGFSVPGTFHR